MDMNLNSGQRARCPACGSADANIMDSYEEHEMLVTHYCTCDDCGADWQYQEEITYAVVPDSIKEGWG